MDKDNKIDWFSFGKSKRFQHFIGKKIELFLILKGDVVGDFSQ